jgi:hypothetical protein
MPSRDSLLFAKEKTLSKRAYLGQIVLGSGEWDKVSSEYKGVCR